METSLIVRYWWIINNVCKLAACINGSHVEKAPKEKAPTPKGDASNPLMFQYRSTLIRPVAKAFGLVAILVCFSISVLGQKEKRLTVVGRVIGVEAPVSSWPMEFETVDIFYVRVEKVLEGKLDSKYLRVAYGHNPSHDPKYNLPAELFEGKYSWQFRLSSWDQFDSEVSVSRLDGDWFDAKNSEVRKTNDLYPENDPRRNQETTLVPITPKCVPVKGYEEEVLSLERRGVIRGYWMDFEKRSLKKMKD